MNRLEHVNITVSDPQTTADLLCGIFGWHIRWAGPSQMGGNTVHVGNDDDYVAVYTYDGNPLDVPEVGRVKGGLNHIGVVVDNLAQVEERVVASGFTPFNHMDYEPGRRFYFLDRDGVEYEVVEYS